jgi:hypothetical protein
MNNRWNEIAYKCWNERKSGRQFDQEMFAELIVRECISIAVAGNAEAVVAVIKERFGVEE